MSTDSVDPVASRPKEEGVERTARRMRQGVMYRALIYVIGLHVFAAIVLMIIFVAPPRH